MKGQRPVGKLNLNTGINLFQHTHKAIGYFYSVLYWVIFFFLIRRKETRECSPLASVACTVHVLVPSTYLLRFPDSMDFQFCSYKKQYFRWRYFFSPQKRQNSARSHMRIGPVILGSFFNLHTLRVLHQCDGNDRGRVWLTGPLRIKWCHISRALNAA